MDEWRNPEEDPPTPLDEVLYVWSGGILEGKVTSSGGAIKCRSPITHGTLIHRMQDVDCWMPKPRVPVTESW